MPHFLSLTENCFFDCYISAITIAYDSLFKTDQDILVLPLDLLKFDTHEQLTQDVLKHFGKVWMIFLGWYLKYNMDQSLGPLGDS